jgi:hypothetical protein
MNVSDQEEIDPPEDTTMLIWEPDLIMPSNDLFDSQHHPKRSRWCKHEVKVNPSQTTLLLPKHRGEYQLPITQENLLLPIRTL